MNEDYNPNSVHAVLSRIETKLDGMRETQGQHSTAIRKLWAALGRLDVRVAVIATSVSILFAVLKLLFFK